MAVSWLTELFRWGIHILTFLFGRSRAERKLLCPTDSAGEGTSGSASRPQGLHFIVLCLVMSAALHAEALVAAAAELRLHTVVVACVAFAVTALFSWAILSITFLAARRPAEGELKTALRPTASAATAPTGSESSPQLTHFGVLCLAMGAALLAEALVAAAADLGIQPGVVACVLLAVEALFKSTILSVNLRVARRPADGEPKTMFRPTGSESRHQLPHFIVLCFAMGTALLAERIVAAAADLGIQPGVVACFVLAVTALLNWAILCINSRVARQAAECEPKMMPQPAAPAARSPQLDRSAFLTLAALMSASWFVEPFAAAAELWLPRAVTVIFISIFAALFNLSTHLVRSSFLPGSQFVSATGAQGQGVGLGAITAGVIATGVAVAACLIGAWGSSTYYVSALARS